MSKRKNIRSKEHFDAALQLEKSGDLAGALKLYQKSVTTDPSNIHSWNRQMILFRKTKSREDEVKLINKAITEYQQSNETKRQDWLKANKEKADSTRELAKVLGLLESDGLPHTEDTTVEKWQTRLYLLEYRIKNSRKKKPTAKKLTPVRSKSQKPTTKSTSRNKRTAKSKSDKG